jgi:membrane protease YdiL (CAAX protease family)
MLGKWGPTEKGLAFLYAIPEYDGGWRSMLGLFGLAIILALLCSIGGYFLGYLLSLLLNIGFEALGRATQQDASELMAWISLLVPNLLAAAGAAFGLIQVVRLISIHSYREFFEVANNVNWKQFAFGFLAFFLFTLTTAIFVGALASQIWPDFPYLSDGVEASDDWPSFAMPSQLYYVYLVVLAPIVWLQTGAEESAFRGAWFQQFGALRGNWVIVIVVTTIAFSLAHLGSAGIVMAAIGLDALAWGYAVIRLGNISYGWGAHFANNYFLMAVIPLFEISIDEIPSLTFNQGPELTGHDGAMMLTIFVTVRLLQLLANILFVQWLTRKFVVVKIHETNAFDRVV